MMNNYNIGYLKLNNKAIIELKAHLLRTYSYLASKDYNDTGVYYSQATMSKELGIHTRTLQRHIKALKELGFLAVRRRGFNMTNLYTILKNITIDVKKKSKEIKSNFEKKFPVKRNAFVEDCPNREGIEEYYSSIEEQLLGWN